MGFVGGSLNYVYRMIGWLGARNMKAIIDLHAFPGSVANEQSFNGVETNGIHGFEQGNWDWGQKILKNMTLWIKALETDSDANKRNVVIGIEPMNEPDSGYTDQAFLFYQENVPTIRTVLDANRYGIFLSLMINPGDACAKWDSSWQNVFLDHHIYHAYGDDTSSASDNYCKTCCRDRAFMQPCSNMNVPTIVGEWSLTTGSANLMDPSFLSTFYQYQVSSYANEGSNRGFFFWSANTGWPNDSDTFLQFDLLRMANRSEIPTFQNWPVCPGQDLNKCPSFPNPQWNSPCSWNANSR